MKSAIGKILLVIGAVLYVILLIWPLSVLLSFMVFSGITRTIVTILLIALEFCIGIFFTLRQYKKQKESKKTGSKVLFGFLFASFLIFSVTVIVYLIQVLMNVI